SRVAKSLRACRPCATARSAHPRPPKSWTTPGRSSPQRSRPSGCLRLTCAGGASVPSPPGIGDAMPSFAETATLAYQLCLAWEEDPRDPEVWRDAFICARLDLEQAGPVATC